MGLASLRLRLADHHWRRLLGQRKLLLLEFVRVERREVGQLIELLICRLLESLLVLVAHRSRCCCCCCCRWTIDWGGRELQRMLMLVLILVRRLGRRPLLIRSLLLLRLLVMIMSVMMMVMMGLIMTGTIIVMMNVMLLLLKVLAGRCCGGAMI